MRPWMQYLIAFLVFGHGFVYVRIGPIAARTVKGWSGRSWLLGNTITGEHLTSLVATLHGLAGVLMLACAAAIAAGGPLAGWWFSRRIRVTAMQGPGSRAGVGPPTGLAAAASGGIDSGSGWRRRPSPRPCLSSS